MWIRKRRRALKYKQMAQLDGQSLQSDAQWLHQYYVMMGESAQQRAMAVLAFGGVLLALLPGVIPLLTSAHQSALLAIGMALIVAALACAASALTPRDSRISSASELRAQFDRIANAGEADALGTSAFISANRLLKPSAAAKDDDDGSVIGAERALTRSRMTLLSWGIWLIFSGLAVLGIVLTWAAYASVAP